ncbi:MAG: hypothetical protein ACD_58C00326G0001 [uncultured bacterium]|nr:MAG: hypothetical protein ACD_58C00326G0001 [uncultured bacterium]
MKYYLGLDCGSVSMKAVIIDENDKIIKSYYTKNHGLVDTVKKVISNLQFDGEVVGVGITGSGREFISLLIGGDIIESEIIAHYLAATTLYPDVNTIIDIGGEDSKLMIIKDRNLTSFAMNRDCGGGTGAMIESISHRLGVPLEEIGDTALRSKTKVILPSKCGIFAQSAVVSKLNKGVPKEDILMGVCKGLVGTYFTMLAKGKRLVGPYIFQGATAKNKALVKCFEEELKTDVIVPNNPELMGAFGVALLVKQDFKGKSNFKGFDVENTNFKTETFYGWNCTNKCEVTMVSEDNKLIGFVGNRCLKCPSEFKVKHKVLDKKM